MTNKNLIVIDVTKKHPEKIVYTQDIADIEYIPLETNDSTLIDRRKQDVVSEQYIVYHNQNGQVLVFNRQGKRLYSFNRTGGGPEEYDSIDEIVLDEKRKNYILQIANLIRKFMSIRLMEHLSVNWIY
ncbi:MAG: 6-bladed beta-propeller [Bacteroides thetaiotaomicron]